MPISQSLRSPFHHFLFTIFLFTAAHDVSARTWTRKDGKTAEGSTVAVKGDTVTILLSNNQEAHISIKSLSLEDQQFLKTWKSKPPKRPIQVPEDAIYHNGSWYAVVIEKTTWKKAADRAEKMDGHLAWIKDEETNAILTKLAGPLHLWIGASDEEVEDLWKWTDGEKITWFNWDRGEPNNGGRIEHYMQMRAGGKWNDVGYNSPTPVGFIVQWD